MMMARSIERNDYSYSKLIHFLRKEPGLLYVDDILLNLDYIFSAIYPLRGRGDPARKNLRNLLIHFGSIVKLDVALPLEDTATVKSPVNSWKQILIEHARYILKEDHSLTMDAWKDNKRLGRKYVEMLLEKLFYMKVNKGTFANGNYQFFWRLFDSVYQELLEGHTTLTAVEFVPSEEDEFHRSQYWARKIPTDVEKFLRQHYIVRGSNETLDDDTKPSTSFLNSIMKRNSYPSTSNGDVTTLDDDFVDHHKSSPVRTSPYVTRHRHSVLQLMSSPRVRLGRRVTDYNAESDRSIDLADCYRSPPRLKDETLTSSDSYPAIKIEQDDLSCSGILPEATNSSRPKRRRIATSQEFPQEKQGLKVGIGITDFAKLTGFASFVDKTSLIREVFDGSSNKLVTMPKKFGKTLVVSMLKCFSAIEVNEQGNSISRAISLGKPVQDTDNYKMFVNRKLKIVEDKEIMDRHFGKYPVIHLDLKSSETVANEAHAVSLCSFVVHRAYKEHDYLLHSNKLNERLKQKVAIWCDDTEHHNFDGNTVIEGLFELSQCLFLHFNRRCLVLVDNYDSITLKAVCTTKNDKSIAAVHNYLMELFTGLLNANKYVCYSFITGVSSSASVDLSQINNLTRHNFFKNGPINYFYGFTISEVNLLFQKFSIRPNIATEARSYYRGYKMADGIYIYNFWSISKFLMTKNVNNYWSDCVTTLFFDCAFECPQIRILKLMCGQSIDIELINKVTIDNLVKLSKLCRNDCPENLKSQSIVFSFLAEEGFLTFDQKKTDSIWSLRIPNREVMDVFYGLSRNFAETIPNFDMLKQYCCALFHNINSNSTSADDRINLTNILQVLKEIYDSMIIETIKNREPFQSLLLTVFLLAPAAFRVQLSVSSIDCNRDTFDFCVLINDCAFIINLDVVVDGTGCADLAQAMKAVIVRKYDKELEQKDEWQHVKKCFLIVVSMCKQKSANLEMSMMYITTNLQTDDVQAIDNRDFISPACGKFIFLF